MIDRLILVFGLGAGLIWLMYFFFVLNVTGTKKRGGTTKR